MATRDNAPSADTDGDNTGGRPGRGRQVVLALTALGVLIGGVALARDYFDVTWPGAGQERTEAGLPSAPPPGPGPTAPATGASASDSTPPAPSGVPLDTLPVREGGANLVPLPRALADQPGYDRPVSVSCPHNTSADKHREVVYPLLRRYLDLTTTVRPWSPDDPQAKAYVTVFVNVTQADGTIQRLNRAVGGGDPRSATPLTAVIEGADELVLRVQCDSPTGIVVLTGSRLVSG
ncbi:MULTISPECIES: hypothetical protein [Micromonospora]|uniref:hypothetical protein n=1 Tax=Micromonospora TaxID=1873 RepID=UPI000C886062|nr:hypothetical protein [Verrucosispora sp. ts21]PMR61347.1 hypothetical protein C1A38_09430 [Verrucosispora sp. ts21]